MPKIIKKHGKTALILGLILVLVVMYLVSPVGQAAAIANRQMTVSDTRPDQTGVTYDFEGDHSGTTVYCLEIKFCTTATGGCTFPSAQGMSMSVASATSTGWGNWTYSDWSGGFATTAEGFKYTNATGEGGGNNYSFSAANITNPSANTYYARAYSYTEVGCSTEEDSGVTAFAIISGVSVTATVAETLSFSIAGLNAGSVNGATITETTSTATSVPLGELSTTAKTVGAQTLTVSTNATQGYTTTIEYTGPLNSSGASYDITDHTGTNGVPTTMSTGTEAFAYTTEDSSLSGASPDRFTSAGGNKWARFYTDPYEVTYSTSAVNNETTDVGYEANIDGTTPAGDDYSTTVIFVCTPIY